MIVFGVLGGGIGALFAIPALICSLMVSTCENVCDHEWLGGGGGGGGLVIFCIFMMLCITRSHAALSWASYDSSYYVYLEYINRSVQLS
jgi:hypothetical protein